MRTERPVRPWQSEFDELAAFRAGSGLAISLYLGFDPRLTLTGDEVATHLASLLAEARRAGGPALEGAGHAGRRAFEDDLARIRDSALAALGPGGVALFASGESGLWRTFEVPSLRSDAVRVGTGLYLVPLVAAPAVERALVAAVGRERGEIFELREGRLDSVASLSEEQPRRHHEGKIWRAPKLLRNIDLLAHEHLRTVAGELDRLVRHDPLPLVLAGEREHTAALAEQLSHEARAALAGTVACESHVSPVELARLVAPLLETRPCDEEQHLAERWREAALRGAGAAVHGFPDTLAAASTGRVALLLFTERAAAPGFECPACGFATAQAGACPLDGQPLAAHPDAVDLAVRRTLVHGGEARVVRELHDLDPVGGIGALLTF